MYGRLEGINILIHNNADVNARSDYGNTPLYIVKDKGNKEAVELLKAAGAKR